MTDEQDPRPIPVHVTSIARAELEHMGALAAAAAPPSSPSSPATRTTRTVYRTVTLTAVDPVQEIMAASDDRLGAQVIVIDADVFLSDNKSDAATGRGSYIPCVMPSSAKPNLAAPVPVQDRRVVYAGPVAAITGTNVIRISVIAVYRD